MAQQSDSFHSKRIVYADWLRVLGMCTVFLFHVGRYFDPWGWHVKNPITYSGIGFVVSFLVLWIMPLFFTLSSIVEAHSIERQKFSRFLQSKCLRLGIPLIFGIFILVPHQIYIERLTQSGYQGSFISFIPHYFDGFYAYGGNFAWMGLHLWYLLVLFLFALITYPLFNLIVAKKFKMKILQSTVSVFFLVPLGYFIPEILLDPASALGQRGFGGWTGFHYLVLFIILFVFARHGLEKLQDLRMVFFILALVTTVVLAVLVFGYGIPAPFGSHAFYGISALKVFSAWFILASVIGYGMRYLTFSNRFLEYANEAVLPFYMLHQSVIVLYGYFIRNTDINPAIKYLLLASISFCTVMLMYHLIVRRFKVTRLLFGMKIR